MYEVVRLTSASNGGCVITAKEAVINLVEAAYNLEVGSASWLPQLLQQGHPALDFGVGVAAAILGGMSDDGQPLVMQMHVGAGAPDLPLRYMSAAREVGPEVVQATSAENVGGVNVLSELKDRWPQVYEALTRHVGCKDILTLWALDPDLHGVNLSIPSPAVIQLTPAAREHWQMLVVHIAAGHRLRNRLTDAGPATGVPVTEMPLNAEALLDPTKFIVSQAAGGAQDSEASKTIREAAVRVDKARGKLRKSDPEEALELWHGLVRGRWSLVDWFDTDGRRFVLAKPNAPHIGDPRGLTEREHQVATYAALGESNKLLSYRFGISRPRVSKLLNSAMHKLGVKTQAQLIEKMRGLPGRPEALS